MMSDATFPKKERLRSRSDFDRVFDGGQSKANQLLVLYVLPVPGERRRYGIAVGRRFGNAVQRNRAKRLLRETYRLNKGRLKQGYELVVIPRRPVLNAGLEQVEMAFEDLASKMGLLKEALE